MQITPEQILSDYVAVATEVLEHYQSLSPEQQQYDEDHQTARYHWHRSCGIGLNLAQQMPPPLTISNAQLVTDTWSFVSTSGRIKLQAENHPYYQAWAEVSSE